MPPRKRTVSSKKRLSMLKFAVDDLVFGKYRNRPHWPGKVLALPDEENKKYRILFFGCREEISLPEKNLVDFRQNLLVYGRPSPDEVFNVGLWEAEHNPDLLSIQRPKELKQLLERNFAEKTERENPKQPLRQKQNEQLPKKETKHEKEKQAEPKQRRSKSKTSRRSSTNIQPDVLFSPRSDSSVEKPDHRSPLLSPSAQRRRPSATTGTPGSPSTPCNTPSTPSTTASRRATCLALKVPNNTPMSPPKNKRTTRAQKRASTEPTDALSDVGLFMERIQALERKQKARRKSRSGLGGE